jgi:opacity protein-like surface antigen
MANNNVQTEFRGRNELTTGYNTTQPEFKQEAYNSAPEQQPPYGTASSQPDAERGLGATLLGGVGVSFPFPAASVNPNFCLFLFI